MFLEYLLIGFLGYLLLSFCISTLGDKSFIDVAKSPAHIYGLIFLYWWLPLFRIADMKDHNKKIKKASKTNENG